MRLNVIHNRRAWFSLSGLLVIASIIAVVVWGLRFGIDFTGGSLLELQFAARPEKQAVQEQFAKSGIEQVQLQALGDTGFLVRLPFIDASTHEKLIEQLNAAYGTTWREERFETIGPSISNELKTNTFYAIVLVSLAIVLYVAWAFRRVSEPVNSWKYGVCAIISLLHDIIIPTGVFAVLGRFAGIEVDVLFVTALLAILGYSVNDTIVTFDRIRENLLKRRHDAFEDIVDDSINETVSRSINTTLTTLLALVAVYFFGGETTRSFTLALIIGITSGAYSSIFLASPLLVSWYRMGK